jgi:dimethylargininase
VKRLTRAILRRPGANFAAGLTSARLGAPVLELALEQHERYGAALAGLGLELIVLDADLDFPDSTFVEDAAVLTPECAILTRPGAPSRRGEVQALRALLVGLFPRVEAIETPGLLDGGDVCLAGERCFIGLSARTNEEGARQLAHLLERQGIETALIDVRPLPGLLHLKSGLSWLGAGDLVAVDALRAEPALRGFGLLPVAPDEEYAANCLRVNERVLVAAGCPRLEETLERSGYSPLALEMSEFRKQDGGLSCLSLRC